jgi:hypothetical protein
VGSYQRTVVLAPPVDVTTRLDVAVLRWTPGALRDRPQAVLDTLAELACKRSLAAAHRLVQHESTAAIPEISRLSATVAGLVTWRLLPSSDPAASSLQAGGQEFESP